MLNCNCNSHLEQCFEVTVFNQNEILCHIFSGVLTELFIICLSVACSRIKINKQVIIKRKK